MPNGMYGGVRGKETKIGRKTISFPYLLDYFNQAHLQNGRTSDLLKNKMLHCCSVLKIYAD